MEGVQIAKKAHRTFDIINSWPPVHQMQGTRNPSPDSFMESSGRRELDIDQLVRQSNRRRVQHVLPREDTV